MPGAGVSPVRKRDPSQLPNFSGNGTAVAAMRAALHQCPPSGGEEGGGFGGDLAVLSIGT